MTIENMQVYERENICCREKENKILHGKLIKLKFKMSLIKRVECNSNIRRYHPGQAKLPKISLGYKLGGCYLFFPPPSK